MQLQLPIQFPELEPKIKYGDKIYLLGSCFTQHMYNYLDRYKFQCRQNSHGILFNPFSVARALHDVIHAKQYSEQELFFLNEYYNSWNHHSDFSHLTSEETLLQINTRIAEHHQFLKEANAVCITLGSAFAYWLRKEEHYVGNNHRAPSDWFRKDLLPIEKIQTALESIQHELHQLNPNLSVIYTISPVRHVRDGVIDNNRSKARLIEAVHALPNTYYFPAYELVIDVLRDYRFFDTDLVHPNYGATQIVWEYFTSHCIDPREYATMEQVNRIYKARHHKPKNTTTKAHQEFLQQHAALCQQIMEADHRIDLTEERNYFSKG